MRVERGLVSNILQTISDVNGLNSAVPADLIRTKTSDIDLLPFALGYFSQFSNRLLLLRPPDHHRVKWQRLMNPRLPSQLRPHTYAPIRSPLLPLLLLLLLLLLLHLIPLPHWLVLQPTATMCTSHHCLGGLKKARR